LQKNNTYTYDSKNLTPESPKSQIFMPRKVPSPRPLEAPERRRLPPLLRRAWYGLNQAFRRRIAHLSLTPDQFTALRTLLEHEGISQRQLAALMSSDPNTVASLVERMESAGLIVRRTREQDRRAHRLCVKPAGRAKFAQARDVALALQAEVLRVLPAEARETFLASLDRIADACHTAATNPPPRTNGAR
jgi:DNA-binding MarR family transcriptional regulator